MTIVLKNPCARAVFETSPNPFSDITVAMPLTSTISTPFHVYTDVEKAFPSIQCNITATFTTTYTPLTISTTQTSLDTTKVVLPTDIGTRTVTVRIASKDFPYSVIPVSFSFNVIVTCNVTSFTITTSVVDFNYTLNQGNLLKGAFTPTAVSDCKHPVTFSLSHTTNVPAANTFVDNNLSVFNTSTKFFSFAFSNSALIDSVQTYVLTATMVTAMSGTLTASKTINITILPDCLNSAFVDKALSNLAVTVQPPTASQSMDVSFTDTTANRFSNPSMCGPRTYTFSSALPTPLTSLPSFLQLDPATNMLTLQTSNPADTGSRTWTMTVILQNYALVSISKTFTTTITCVVNTVTWSTPPASILIEPEITV